MAGAAHSAELLGSQYRSHLHQSPGDTQGCIPKLCPEGAALGSHQPDPGLTAGVGDTCTTLSLSPVTQKYLIYNRATLQSPAILLFLGMD